MTELCQVREGLKIQADTFLRNQCFNVIISAMNPNILERRVEKILPSKEALQKIMTSKKIRIYQGFDPTGGRLHLGHTIGLRKLMDFAREGHEVIFLFGTGTVLVGDPSERDTGRKLITQEEIDQNIKDWKSQVAPIVDFSLPNVKVMQNGDWLTKLTLKDLVGIASNISAVQLFKRESFTRRIKNGDTVWYHETMYPLLQGYDSVAMNVDLEIGGTDQEFNMLVGRELQRKMNNHEKSVLTVPMILGTDGGQMSKSTGNCIWLSDTANDMYGKVMSIPDAQISSYWQLLTDLPIKPESELLADPMINKKILALDITRQIHGDESAKEAQINFENTVQNKQAPSNLESFNWIQGTSVSSTASEAGFGASNSDRKRMIEQGGFKIDGVKHTNPNQTLNLKGGEVIQYGKRDFKKVTLIES